MSYNRRNGPSGKKYNTFIIGNNMRRDQRSNQNNQSRNIRNANKQLSSNPLNDDQRRVIAFKEKLINKAKKYANANLSRTNLKKLEDDPYYKQLMSCSCAKTLKQIGGSRSRKHRTNKKIRKTRKLKKTKKSKNRKNRKTRRR